MSQPKEKTLTTVKSSVQWIAEKNRESEQGRGLVDRMADGIGDFSGSMTFVLVHAIWFLVWFLINTGVLPFLPRFDPYPFILLAMIVSVEGVLLSTFVLMKQNRMQQRSDSRDHVNLQIDLLAEKEVTKALQLLRIICRKLEISEVEGDTELVEMATTTSLDTLAAEMQKARPQG